MTRKILLIDNYDSFVYNIAQYVGLLGVEVETRRNDVTLPEIEKIDPDAIIISPGPGRPEDSGISPRVVEKCSNLPILGVCLGHQVIGQVFGAKIEHAPMPVHGKASMIEHCGTGIYEGLENPFSGIRYHSLVVSPNDLPGELTITSRTRKGIVMGIRHRNLPVEGVQFHPESILTMGGKGILNNFLESIR
jgi:anthranilate synthase/aminodeoxychorismate synthase-like glutamine amidotransferase